MKKIKAVHVPNLEELAVKNCIRRVVKHFPDMRVTIPDFSAKILPEKDFFWGVFSTLHYKTATKLIQNAQKRKAAKDATEKSGVIKILPSIKEALINSSYFSSKHLSTDSLRDQGQNSPLAQSRNRRYQSIIQAQSIL